MAERGGGADDDKGGRYAAADLKLVAVLPEIGGGRSRKAARYRPGVAAEEGRSLEVKRVRLHLGAITCQCHGLGCT